MAAVLSPQTTSQSPSPTALPPRSSPSPNPNHSALPPIVTSPPPKAQSVQRTSSTSKHRLSTFSSRSNASQTQAASRSRPQSTAFPHFHSSLPYTLVRDFAYPPYHPLHYGPPAEQASGMSTPASEAHRRLSDPAPTWERSDGWDSTEWRQGEQLQPTTFGDGPPWSEDEDLHSPVVTAVKHKKNKSNMVAFDNPRGRSRDRDQPRRGSYQGTNGDGSETYYVSELNEAANGPGGEYITYPAGTAAPRLDVQTSSLDGPRRDSHFAASLNNRTTQYDEDMSSSPMSPNDDDEEDEDGFTEVD